MTAETTPIATIVMANPMLFWIARALPTRVGGQARADNAENWGESATTATPHTNMRITLAVGKSTIKGKTRQQAAEVARAPTATHALPTRRLSRPPRTQPSAPTPITANEPTDTFPIATPEASIKAGTTVQNAYSSHM